MRRTIGNARLAMALAGAVAPHTMPSGEPSSGLSAALGLGAAHASPPMYAVGRGRLREPPAPLAAACAGEGEAIEPRDSRLLSLLRRLVRDATATDLDSRFVVVLCGWEARGAAAVCCACSDHCVAGCARGPF
jgi:hypothetical protein